MTLSQSEVIWYTALLPTAQLESISFNTGHYPTRKPHTATATASSTATEESSSTPSSPAPTAVATTTAGVAPHDPNDESGLSPSGQIGAIAGGVAGALLIAILLLGFLCFRRRQRKQQLKREEEARAVDDFMHGEIKTSEPDPVNLGIAPGTIPSPSIASSPDTAALSELDSKAARPWSLRSELDSNSSARSSCNTAAGSNGGIGQARSAPSELAAHPIAELPG